MSEDASGLLGMLIDHEAAIGRLYLAYANRFAERRGLWLSLGEAEQRHAEGLQRVGSEPGIDEWLLHQGGVRPQAIASSIAYVQGETARAETGSINLIQALVVAKDLESALIERHLSRMDLTNCPGAKEHLAHMAAESIGHRDTLARALEEERRSQA